MALTLLHMTRALSEQQLPRVRPVVGNTVMHAPTMMMHWLTLTHSDEPQRDARIRNQGNAYLTVFVGRISFRTTEEAIRREFAAFGTIKSFNLVRDIGTVQQQQHQHLCLCTSCLPIAAMLAGESVTGASRGYAFIEYATEAGFMRAFRDGHGMMLDGARLLVDYQRATVMKGGQSQLF